MGDSGTANYFTCDSSSSSNTTITFYYATSSTTGWQLYVEEPIEVMRSQFEELQTKFFEKYREECGDIPPPAAGFTYRDEIINRLMR